MRKNGIFVCVVAGALALSTVQSHAAFVSTPGKIKLPTWFKVLGTATAICATSIVGAALVKNTQQNKPLTANEATSCGWTFWVR